VVALPKGVHRVVSRGREYFYWQPGRGTKHAAKALPLPSDPQDPAFWVALRAAQGASAPQVVTFGDVIDLYMTSDAYTRKITAGTREQYRRQLLIAKAGFGERSAESIRPGLIRGVVEGLADTPGAANNFLGVMRALSRWGIASDHFPASIAAGVEPYEKKGGHRPWTPAQLAAAEKHLTGMVRRGFLLMRYTGQRGSDVVRLGETFIDEGGFRLEQQKTGREIWCPIDDALAAEIATWERRPGPYLYHARGHYTRKVLDAHFAEQRDKIPGLKGCTLHGLRATRVVELRRAGLTTTQIQDQVGMSLGMIERYCRFADKKASGKASVVSLRERRKNGGL
jgi:integrase